MVSTSTRTRRRLLLAASSPKLKAKSAKSTAKKPKPRRLSSSMVQGRKTKLTKPSTMRSTANTTASRTGKSVPAQASQELRDMFVRSLESSSFSRALTMETNTSGPLKQSTTLYNSLLTASISVLSWVFTIELKVGKTLN